MKWLLSKWITSTIKRIIQIAVSWIVGHNLEQFGVKIDQTQLSLAIWTGLEFLRSQAKIKYGIKWL